MIKVLSQILLIVFQMYLHVNETSTTCIKCYAWVIQIHYVVKHKPNKSTASFVLLYIFCKGIEY